MNNCANIGSRELKVDSDGGGDDGESNGFSLVEISKIYAAHDDLFSGASSFG